MKAGNQIIQSNSFSSPIVNYYLMGILAIPCVIGGIVLAIDKNIFVHFIGLFSISFWCSLLTIRKGTKLDLSHNRIGFYYSYLWIRSTNWISMGSFIKYKIRVINRSYTLSAAKSPASTTFSYRKLAIDLYHKEEKRYRRIAVGEKPEIRSLATILEKDFNLTRSRNRPVVP